MDQTSLNCYAPLHWRLVAHDYWRFRLTETPVMKQGSPKSSQSKFFEIYGFKMHFENSYYSRLKTT